MKSMNILSSMKFHHEQQKLNPPLRVKESKFPSKQCLNRYSRKTNLTLLNRRVKIALQQ